MALGQSLFSGSLCAAGQRLVRTTAISEAVINASTRLGFGPPTFHARPLVAQPLGLGRLGVALVVVRVASSPERQAVLVCCGSCSNCSDGELKAKIIAQITCIRPETSVATAPAVDGPPTLAAAEALASAETKADTDEPLMVAARQAPATWVAAAAKAWVQQVVQREQVARAAQHAQSEPAI
jgi:hypothetical protein